MGIGKSTEELAVTVPRSIGSTIGSVDMWRKYLAVGSPELKIVNLDGSGTLDLGSTYTVSSMYIYTARLIALVIIFVDVYSGLEASSSRSIYSKRPSSFLQPVAIW